ncbi:MAG: DsrE family protein [Gemmatimonadota bacterium]|nr:DsrE family protein [Gemmatimonadota bacterium]
MRTLAAPAALLIAVAAAGAQQQTGPVIQKGGGHFPVPNATFTVPAGVTYKMAWDIAVGSAKPGDANAAYDVPARFVNQAAVMGMARSATELAVVIHGSAGEEVLTNDEYRARKGVDNPNIALLEEMSKAGVKIIICGQTVGSRKMPRDKILPFVLVAPSATWTHAVLQQQGFSINPF